MKFNKIVNWLLLLSAAVMLISGYGIVKFKLVGPIFFGLLEKSDFFKIHSFAAVVFLVLLVLHVFKIRIKK